MAEEAREEKKKLIRIKFAFGHDEEDKPGPRPRHDEKEEHRALHDDDHKQELLDKMSSTSPRRKQAEPEQKSKEKPISETDKLLRELAEEFEVD